MNDHIDPIESIPEVPIVHTQITHVAKIGPIPMLVSMDVSQLLLDEGILARHEHTLGNKETETKIRSMILRDL